MDVFKLCKTSKRWHRCFDIKRDNHKILIVRLFFKAWTCKKS